MCIFSLCYGSDLDFSKDIVDFPSNWLNHQEKSVDYEKTKEREVDINFGSNFGQKRQAPKNMRESLQENNVFSQICWTNGNLMCAETVP
jgi:hypothetical protein